MARRGRPLLEWRAVALPPSAKERIAEAQPIALELEVELVDELHRRALGRFAPAQARLQAGSEHDGARHALVVARSRSEHGFEHGRKLRVAADEMGMPFVLEQMAHARREEL